jgi:radical SAM superfamily enzyme with C-terminal helix-hairpin-helix motif
MDSELIRALRAGVVGVKFTKVSGEERTMICTLCETMLPVREETDAEVNRNRAVNEEVQVVYDLDKKAFRSFRKNSVISYSFGDCL